MKISTGAHYSQDYIGQTKQLQEMEKAGLDMVWVAEAYSFDAVSAMGYLAAKTDNLTIASGILNTYSRSPSLLAMTAAGLDALSEGRFVLGLGASGPQVIEGFHGVKYDAPVSRMREIIEICQQIWERKQKLQHQGKYYQVPLPRTEGSGLGIPLKLINHPRRDNIPIVLATLRDRSVEMTAEVADGWLPAFFMPEGSRNVWGEALDKGNAKRDPGKPPLEVYAGGSVAIGNGLESFRDMARPNSALYIGGMGARNKNFYNEIFQKYGYQKEAKVIQDLYLEGRKSEAEAAVPASFLEATCLVGPKEFVKDRILAYKEAGVTCLNVAFLGETQKERVRNCELLRNIVDSI